MTPKTECLSIKQFFTRRRRISRAQRIAHPQDISQIPQGFISLKKDDYNRNRLFSWCRKPGSNRYEVLSSRDFKSRASTNFAIPAFAVFIVPQNRWFVKGFAGFRQMPMQIGHAKTRTATDKNPQPPVSVVRYQNILRWRPSHCTPCAHG